VRVFALRGYSADSLAPERTFEDICTDMPDKSAETWRRKEAGLRRDLAAFLNTHASGMRERGALVRAVVDAAGAGA
jgi:hypothetical protein